MATLSTMRTETRSIIGQTDSTNSQVTNTQIDAWLNEAYRTFVARMGELPETPYDLTTAAGDIDLDTDILTLLRAYLYGTDSEYHKLEIIGVDVLDKLDPGYMSADTGTPKYLVRNSTFTVFLYPAPDTSNTGLTIKLHTISFPTELSADGDSPLLPKNLQDLMPHYAAWRAFQQMGQTDKATSSLIFVNTQLKAGKQISTKVSGQDNKWYLGQDSDDE